MMVSSSTTIRISIGISIVIIIRQQNLMNQCNHRYNEPGKKITQLIIRVIVLAITTSPTIAVVAIVIRIIMMEENNMIVDTIQRRRRQ